MRWPIRNQILLPFVAIETVTIAAVVIASAWVAVRQVESEIEHRLENVLSTVEAATYPLTQNILNQLNQLSGAEFVVYDQSGSLEAANLSDFDRSKFDAVRTQFEVLEQDLIDDRSIVEISGQRYFTGFVKRNRGIGKGLVFVLFSRESLGLSTIASDTDSASDRWNLSVSHNLGIDLDCAASRPSDSIGRASRFTNCGR